MDDREQYNKKLHGLFITKAELVNVCPIKLSTMVSYIAKEIGQPIKIEDILDKVLELYAHREVQLDPATMLKNEQDAFVKQFNARRFNRH